MIVDRAIYRDGKRTDAPDTLAELNAACRGGAGIAWIGLYRPDAQEFANIAREFELHELAVEDAVKAHQRSKLERYGDTLFLVLRPARYIDETETVEFGEVHVFAGPQFVITIRHAEAPDLHRVRLKLEARPELLSRGPFAIVHAILDRVVDDYAPVIAGIENDIDEIEDDVFEASPTVSRRIYELTREVVEFQRATKPLSAILDGLMRAPQVDDEERRYLRDVQDHALRVQEQADAFRELLHNILNVNLTLETKALSEAANTTNDEVKKISAWAAIFFRPHARGDDLRYELRAHARAWLARRLPVRARAHGSHERWPVRAFQTRRLDLAQDERGWSAVRRCLRAAACATRTLCRSAHEGVPVAACGLRDRRLALRRAPSRTLV